MFRALCVALWLIIGGAAIAQDITDEKVDVDFDRYLEITELLKSDPDVGRAQARAYLADAQEADNQNQIAFAMNLIGIGFMDQSDYETARQWHLDVLLTITPEEEPNLYYAALKKIALGYNNVYDLANSYRYDALALQHADRLGGAVTLNLSKAKEDIAVTLTNNHLYEAAADLMEPLLDDPELERLDRIWVGKTLASALWGMGEHERSVQTFEEAIALLTDDDADNDWIGVNVAYAFVLVEIGDYDRAAQLIPDGLARASRIGNMFEYCSYLSHEVRVLEGTGEPAKAIERYAEYVPVCEVEIGAENRGVRQDVYLLPSVIRAYQALGAEDKAGPLMGRLINSQRQHFDNIQNTRVEIERIRLETEMASTQIKILEQQDALNNATISRQRLLFLVVGLLGLFLFLVLIVFGYRYIKQSRSNHMLEENARQNRDRARSAEKEVEYKDLLIQEINHRVKNNIQSIISILNIHRRQIGSTATEATVDILNDVSNRFHSLAAYQHSLEMVDGSEAISARKLITDLTDKVLATSSTKIDLAFDIDEIKLSSSKAAPLALVLNELISNSLKHGLSQHGGRLSISLKHSGDQLYLTCTDDGLGLSDDFDAKESLGLTIIKSLTRKLRGRLEFTKLRRGTEVRIEFPADQAA